MIIIVPPVSVSRRANLCSYQLFGIHTASDTGGGPLSLVVVVVVVVVLVRSEEAKVKKTYRLIERKYLSFSSQREPAFHINALREPGALARHPFAQPARGAPT